jgi:hypothetical protein
MPTGPTGVRVASCARRRARRAAFRPGTPARPGIRNQRTVDLDAISIPDGAIEADDAPEHADTSGPPIEVGMARGQVGRGNCRLHRRTRWHGERQQRLDAGQRVNDFDANHRERVSMGSSRVSSRLGHGVNRTGCAGNPCHARRRRKPESTQRPEDTACRS